MKEEESVIIIAEAGVNHNGDVNTAKELIDVAVAAGADVIKFQTFKAAKLITPDAPKAEYQKKTGNDSQLEMLKELELGGDDFRLLYNYSKTRGIQFCSTPFDFESIEILRSIEQPFWKIPSGEITNYPYLARIGSFQEKIVMSTGIATMGEIESALGVLIKAGTEKRNICVLHCSTEYPTPFADINLLAMNTIANAFKVRVGYSDHSLGIEIPVAAVALGARIVEKHFTLDKNMRGPDHAASLNPEELKAMVRAIRNIEMSMGSGIKAPTPSEEKNRDIVRKSIVAAKAIRKNEVFTEDNLTTKRPGTGIDPMRWNEIIGTIAERDYMPDEML